MNIQWFKFLANGDDSNRRTQIQCCCQDIIICQHNIIIVLTGEDHANGPVNKHKNVRITL